MLDSDLVRARSAATSIFRAQRLHQLVLHDRRRRGRDRDRSRTASHGLDPLGAGEFFGEMGLISGRRRSSTVRAGAGLRADRDAAPLDAEAHRHRSSRCASAIDEAFLKRAVRAYLAPMLPRRGARRAASPSGVQVEDATAAGEVLFTEGDAPDGAVPDPPRLGDDLAHHRRPRGRAVLPRRRQLRRRDGAARPTRRARPR